MNTAILLAAGSSSRAKQNKLWAEVFGEPLWVRSYKTFLTHPLIDHIILVVPKGEEFKFLSFIDAKKTEIVSGAETRMGSFKRGVDSFRTTTINDIIVDHNAANPNVTAREISEVIAAAQKTGAAAVSHSAVDTLLTVEQGVYTAAIPREGVRHMQTPQAVRGDILQKYPLNDSTDLASALLAVTPVAVVDAHPHNKKVTFAEDLESLRTQTFLGEDSHAFSKAGTLILGGLEIPELPALEANSDGDVILHAIGRALAQACGENFSEIADPLLLSGESNSRDYLEPFLEKVKIQKLALSIECARPKIDPLTPELKSSLAEVLGMPKESIQISAHSGEGLTAFGRGEGMRCLALLTVQPLS